MLRFAKPEYLWALWLLVPLAALFIASFIFKRRALKKFASVRLQEQIVPDFSRTKHWLKQAFAFLAVACFLLAAAQPQIGSRIEEVKRKGIDLFIALDVSLSMKAEDIKPNRLEKAKRDVTTMIRRLQGDRIGLIVFAGEAFVQFPLTVDYSAAELFMSATDVDAVPYPGTMIGSAIELALKSFPNDLPTQKAIVVVSDGENTEGDLIGAVQKAKEAGVRIYTVGQGTPEGGPIPMYESGRVVDFKRDRAGSIVLTKLDESMLQQIAAATGGTYRRATGGGNEILDIFGELEKLEKTELGTMQIGGFEDKFQYPLAAGLLFLLLEALMSERRGALVNRLKRFFATGAIAVIAAGAVMPHANAQTVRSHVAEGNSHYKEGKMSDAELEYRKALEKDPNVRAAISNLGSTEYKQKRYSQALERFGKAAEKAETGEERADSYYNAGNALFKDQKYKESIEAYKSALRLNPSDEDARYNLQLARRLLQMQNQQQQQQQKQQKQDQQQKEEQQKQEQQQQQQQQQRQEQQRQQQQQLAEQRKKLQQQEAERILEAMKNNEKDIQERLRKRQARARVNVEKDW